MNGPNGSDNATWLPNLVGGVSIWKLAVDLNEAKFFDGRLLVPETEGSESLPVTVRWDLTGLVPLVEALKLHPDDVAAAVKDFQAALARVAKVFSTPNSGYDKYKEAFTVPSLEADGGANYFFSPQAKKLFVINWGASPRAMGGKQEFVFGYEEWGKVFPEKAAALAAASAAAASAPAIPVAAAAAAVPAEKKDEKKEEKPKDEKAKPWWIWPLFALLAIALVLLALFLFRACEDQTGGQGKDASADALAEAGADAEAGALDAGDDASALALEAGADGSAADDAGDASADAAGDGGRDGGKDGGKDGGLATDDEDDDDPDDPGGGGGGGGKVVVTMGGAPGGNTPAAKSGPHRRHYQKEATKWRIVAGNDRIVRTEARGRRFDVWLAPNKTFQGVGVEWQDASGKWHAH